MTACPEMRFEGVTEDAWRQIVAAMGSSLEATPDSGTTEKMGVRIAWNRDAVLEILTIQCLSKPFIVSCAMVEAQIRGLVGAGLARG